MTEEHYIAESEFGEDGQENGYYANEHDQQIEYLKAGEILAQYLDRMPAEFVFLFDLDPERLKMLTRTPRGAMASTVWLDVIDKASDPKVDLLHYFLDVLDKRNIAVDGKGRDEAREILVANRLANTDEEGEEVVAPDWGR